VYKWDEDDLKEAKDEYRKDVSVQPAAENYGIPKSSA
jgi:hypothetical protein